MEGLTSGERVLLFAILGLFAAAGLVQLGSRSAASTPSDSPPTEIQLVALEQLAQAGSEADPAQTRRIALGIASNRLAQPKDRAKAVDICARHGISSALPLCRSIVAAEKVSTTLRLSAISAVAVLGDKEDASLLEQLASSEDSQLRSAAERALSQLRKQG